MGQPRRGVRAAVRGREVVGAAEDAQPETGDLGLEACELEQHVCLVRRAHQVGPRRGDVGDRAGDLLDAAYEGMRERIRADGVDGHCGTSSTHVDLIGRTCDGQRACAEAARNSPAEA